MLGAGIWDGFRSWVAHRATISQPQWALFPFVPCVLHPASLLLLPLVPAVPPLWLCCLAVEDPALPGAPRESPDLSVSYLNSVGGPCCFSAAFFLLDLSPLFPQWLGSLLPLAAGSEHP